ncbi:MAG: hypothetical protein ACK5IB_07190 [Qingshengfaniella sp.]
MRIAAILLFLLAACGPRGPHVPETLSSVATITGDSVALESRQQFEQAIIGHNLRGDGVDVVVAEGGMLIGRQQGRPFTGSWTFDKGRFCYALADQVTRRNARCFRAAVLGREVHLSPITD